MISASQYLGSLAPNTNYMSYFNYGNGAPTIAFKPAGGFGQFSMNMVPQFGGGVLGNQSPRIPTSLPGFTARPNTTGGYDYSIPSPVRTTAPTTTAAPSPLKLTTQPVARTQVSPIVPGWGVSPTAPAAAPATGVPAAPTGATTTAPVTPAAPTITPWTPPTPAAPPPFIPSGTNSLSSLLQQASTTATPTAPDLPDLGIKDQAVLNLLAYNQYMQNQANAQNDLYWQMGAQAMQGQGTSAKADIDRAAAQQNAANIQSLMSRGLGNSTITGNMSQGVNSDAALNKAKVDESTAQMFMNWLNQRQMQGPDQSAFAELIRAAMNKPDPNLVAGNLPANMAPITTAATPSAVAPITAAAAPAAMTPAQAIANANAQLQARTMASRPARDARGNLLMYAF